MKKLLTLLAMGCSQALAQPHLKFTEYDLNVGIDASSPGAFCIAGNQMFFTAIGAGTGKELWVTDGTPAGTKMVKDIWPGLSGSAPSHMVAVGNKLFFVALDGMHGRELWVSDGTAGGTQMVKDVYSGAPDGIASGTMVVLNNKLVFGGNNGVNGDELWISDGTTIGTQMLKDIRPGADNSLPSNFASYNGKIYFAANDGVALTELWVTDGTSIGTQMVKDIHPSGSSSPYLLTAALGKLFFGANTGMGMELWVTDGTSIGTQMVRDINPTNAGGFSASEIVEYNNRIYFGGSTGLSSGIEPWVSDGTFAGTMLLAEINATSGSMPADFTEYKGKLYFRANNGVDGVELWVTDGTMPGTVQVKDILPGFTGSIPSFLTVFNDYLYFAAQQSAGNGQLFATDGTANGTKAVFAGTTAVFNPVAQQAGFAVFDSSLWMKSNYTSNDFELWSVRDTVPIVRVADVAESAIAAIYPNPGNGVFTVELKEYGLSEAGIVVTDIAGRVVYQAALPGRKHKVDLHNAAKGTYMLQVRVGDVVHVERISIE